MKEEKFLTTTRLGFVHGIFDGLFPKAIMFLQDAKLRCDHLTVGMNTHGGNESVFSRWKRLKSCTFVDNVIPYQSEWDLEMILRNTDYEFRFMPQSSKGLLFWGLDIKPDKNLFLPTELTEL